MSSGLLLEKRGSLGLPGFTGAALFVRRRTETRPPARRVERPDSAAGPSPAIHRCEVFADLKAILADIPGVKGLWINTKRIQPSDFSRTFVIEFADRDSYDAYVKHPKKKAWDKHYYGIREQSFNCITVN